MSNIFMKDNTYNLLKRSMDATVLRSKVIGNNIANINTKGYKRFEVSFEESLKEQENKYDMNTTNSKHIGSGTNADENGTIKLKKDESTSMRQDGNNVDIENEMTNLAANTLMYNALVKEVSGKIANTNYIINGGK